MEKYKKSYRKTINSKYQLLHGMINLNYLMDNIWYEIFKIVLSTPSKEKLTGNPPIKIYVNEIENGICF